MVLDPMALELDAAVDVEEEHGAREVGAGVIGGRGIDRGHRGEDGLGDRDGGRARGGAEVVADQAEAAEAVDQRVERLGSRNTRSWPVLGSPPRKASSMSPGRSAGRIESSTTVNRRSGQPGSGWFRRTTEG